MTATSDATNEWQQSDGQPAKIRTLLIMDAGHSRPLLEVLNSCGIDVLLAQDCNGARKILEIEPSVQVLLTDRTFRDQDWVGLFGVMDQMPAHTQVILCCRGSDHRQMIAALELGAYDVLFEPYERDEILRIVGGAAAKSDRCAQRSAERKNFHTMWLPAGEVESALSTHAARESLRWSEMY
jgi:DNA-binding NtrC family response regulator